MADYNCYTTFSISYPYLHYFQSLFRRKEVTFVYQKLLLFYPGLRLDLLYTQQSHLFEKRDFMSKNYGQSKADMLFSHGSLTRSRGFQ